MAVLTFLVLLGQSLTLRPQMAGYQLDGAARERMEQREELLGHEKARRLQQLQQLQQRTQEQSGFSWGALLSSASQQWQFRALVVALVLLFGLCLWLRRRSREPGNRDGEETSSSSTEREEEEQEEEEEEDDDPDGVARFLEEHIQWPVQDRSKACEAVESLIGSLILIFRQLLLDSFFPILQTAIKVGSAFEGWSPRGEDVVYRMFVPLRAPRGHTFRLELDTAEEGPARNFHVRVEPVCICMSERLGGRLLCFLHHSEEELRNQDTSLLRSLCTGSFLDVQKTASWLQNLVRKSWKVLPHSAFSRLTVLPSSRSCKFKVTTGKGKSLTMELLFGVRQGDSDVFVSSQSTEGLFMPSTTWPESYTVAEAEFLGCMAGLLPRNSCHLKCLQLCARILPGTCFSTSTLKTVVMHLLNSTPPSNWRRMNVLLRLQEVMRYLHHCLEEKRLDHVFIGNENTAELASVPLPTREAEPLNLFQHLAQDPAAHAEALREFMDLRDRLVRLLLYGH